MKPLSLAAFAVALVLPLQAQAACRLVTADVAVTMAGLRPLVAAKIAGKPVKLLLDSGAFGSSLTASYAAQEKLSSLTAKPIGSLVPGSASTVTSGARGHDTTTGIVIAPSFEFGGSVFPDVKFLTIRDIGDAAGLVGQNLLKTTDDEYDFKDGLLRLVRPLDCETTAMAYWLKPGETYSVVPLDGEARRNAHNVALITINGQTMRAYFDTGASTSFITVHAAAKAGVKTSDPGVTPIGVSHGLDGDIKTWVGTFSSIKIGDEEIKNGKLAIGESVANDFDVLIGADFFMAHHVYVANSQGKLYFSYSGGPVFRTSAPANQTASGDTPPR
ncbi:retropepsin-like aspartic protease [Phenylobacterium sp.]|uniref:retropepsin-like aspartic protease n=1 Tax=Phenylobacterium sp. TaxID=1871053 RepID=UPI0025D32E3A|nr:retropepsin-like aspartic protease [Phenylobacterium sp.]